MNAIETDALGKRHGRRWALRDCSMAIPEGSVVGLVGVNGAGKSTLLHLLVGLSAPTEGTATVAGGRPGSGADQLGLVGFQAQSSPCYPNLTIADHLALGGWTNPGWDQAFAAERIDRLGLDLGQKAGSLSGGQRAQLGLTMAMGKRPRVLVLDEPGASLDPLAHRALLEDLMVLVAEHQPTVVLSSHQLTDIERVCDHLVVLADGRVRVAGDVDTLRSEHRRLVGERRPGHAVPADQHVVTESHTDRQTTLVVRTAGPILDPRWSVSELSLEDIVLAYMASPGADPQPGRKLTVAGGS